MSRLVATGRILTGLFFGLAGVNKVATYGETLDAMTGAGLPAPALLLPLVIALEIGGGAVVAVGRGGRWLVAAALALALFTLLTNAVFHRFWDLDGPVARLELSLFFKNLVVAAALVMIAGLALDR
ncbi:MAG: DoxX family membrane protein, partial [Litorimonas sp.]